MKNEDEIFEEYVLKRLAEDHNIGDRPYLYSHEFNLIDSPSLNFLAETTGVKLHHPEPHWITEESDEENGINYYRDEKERIYVIDTGDILHSRRKNMERIFQELPESLSKKIQAFEENTKYLYMPSPSSIPTIIDGLKNALKQFDGNDTIQHNTIQRLIITHARRIIPEPSKRQEKAIIKLREKLEKKQTGQNRFYALIKDIHNPKNKNKRIELYNDLLKYVKNRDEEDVRRFLAPEDYHMTSPEVLASLEELEKTGKQNTKHYLYMKKKNIEASKRLKILKTQFSTELVRDIYEQLYKLYKADMNPKAKLIWQDLEAYNKACDHYQKRLLGPKGAFEKGGIYGPDSKFSGIGPNDGPPPPSGPGGLRETAEDSNPAIQEEEKKAKYTQLKIFNDSDFEY